MLFAKKSRGFSRRRFLRLSAAAGLGVVGTVLVACAGGATPTPVPQAPAGSTQGTAPTKAPDAPAPTAAPPSSSEPVTLRYGTSWAGYRIEVIDPVLKEWSKTSKINVEIESVPSNHAEKLVSQIAGGTVPDTFRTINYMAPKMYSQGVILDLSSYTQRDGIDLKKDYGLMGVEIWDGKTYAMPWVLSPHAWYYNKTLLAENGAPDPWDDLNGDLSWDDMVTIAKAVTKDTNGDGKPDVWGIKLGYNNLDYQLGGIIYSNGGKTHDYETMQYTLTDPKTVEAVQFVYDLVHTEKVIAPLSEVTQLEQAGITAPFQAGIVAMEEDSTGRLTTNADNIKDKFEWDVFPIPRFRKDGGPGVPYVSGDPNSAYAKSKVPDAAWETLKFMAGPVMQGTLSKVKLLQPALLSAVNDPEGFLKPPPAHIDVFLKVYEGRVTRRFFHETSQECVNVITKYLDLIFLQQLSVADGLKQANDEVNAMVEYTSKPTITD